MLVDKFSVEWLKKSMEKIVRLREESDFIDSSREGNKAFIAQKASNRAGRFVEIAEHRVGGRRGLIVPEGRQGRGWKLSAAELGKVVTLFSSSPGSHSVMPLIQHPRDLGGSNVTDKEVVLASRTLMSSSVDGGRNRT
jgi:hypothetical protein